MKREGFSLLELILVMAILTSIFAITVPSLGRFFRGQSIEEETRRFLTLTRYAPNLAISSNIPMILWVDEMNNTYGIRPQNGFEYALDREIAFKVDEAVEIEVLPNRLVPANRIQVATLSKYTSGLMSGSQMRQGVTQLLFLPDGTLEQEGAPIFRFQLSDEVYFVGKALIGTDFKVLDEEEQAQYEVLETAANTRSRR
ncbi:MAG: pilus assembly FimT family protein [bacterium]|jgi:prepilin-type N-terminal cleavage/methylation domain-containing protein